MIWACPADAVGCSDVATPGLGGVVLVVGVVVLLVLIGGIIWTRARRGRR